MERNLITKIRICNVLLLVSVPAVNAAAQTAVSQEIDTSGSFWWFAMIFIVLVGLGGAYYFWRKSKKGLEQPQYNYGNRYRDYYSTNASYELGDVDAEKELEWLRKAKKPPGKIPPLTFGPKGTRAMNATRSAKIKASIEEPNLDTKLFQEKMKKLQYAQLPINSFNEMTPAKQYEPLPVSNDQSLMSAIEQAYEEFEEDEAVRDLAVRILAAFRTKNSVEALSQIALYDLSSNLRSKAVSILTDFDHESVFEAILLACADPTREVRAAAARGLFRLNFDRSGAWKRIIETGDEFRMSHAVRAAIESGIVQKSFDRLVHEDLKIAYEAFSLVALMIKAGEDHEIFEAIRNHRDERVRFALLHVMKAVKDERSLDGLNDLRQNEYLTTDLVDRVQDTIKSYEHVMA
jgi:hypothetical protein